MSKLYNEYLKLKEKNNNIIYIFKSGIFYICLDEDAKILSNIFDFKITPLNEQILKCGFPIKRINYYTKLLQQMNIEFEIIDSLKSDSNCKEYSDNAIIKSIIKKINNLDMDNISYKKAFDLLCEMQDSIKKLNLQ